MARLLIVDDESGIRGALEQLFEYEGHEVRTAEDGIDGIDLAGEFRPDVIFLDVKMPGLDGLDVLQRIRADDPGALVDAIAGENLSSRDVGELAPRASAGEQHRVLVATQIGFDPDRPDRQQPC